MFDVSGATDVMQDLELKLLHSDQVEPLLPKSFKNRDRQVKMIDATPFGLTLERTLLGCSSRCYAERAREGERAT